MFYEYSPAKVVKSKLFPKDIYCPKIKTGLLSEDNIVPLNQLSG